MDLTAEIAKELVPSSELPSFKSGDTITVFYKIKEGDKERTQFFKGDVLQRKGNKSTETFTIRKISNGIAVEYLKVVKTPIIDTIEINKLNSPNSIGEYKLVNNGVTAIANNFPKPLPSATLIILEKTVFFFEKSNL